MSTPYVERDSEVAQTSADTMYCMLRLVDDNVVCLRSLCAAEWDREVPLSGETLRGGTPLE